MENCARDNSKSTREKPRFKISIINSFSYAISETLAGLRYGYFSPICLMLSSRLYFCYFGQIFRAPAATFSYYDQVRFKFRWKDCSFHQTMRKVDGSDTLIISKKLAKFLGELYILIIITIHTNAPAINSSYIYQDINIFMGNRLYANQKKRPMRIYLPL